MPDLGNYVQIMMMNDDAFLSLDVSFKDSSNTILKFMFQDAWKYSAVLMFSLEITWCSMSWPQIRFLV